jgi:hypothetical protein
MAASLAVMTGYRSSMMNLSSFEEYSLQSSVLMARMSMESNTREELKRLLGFAGMS